MKWTITAYQSYLEELTRLWTEEPDLRDALNSIDSELEKHKSELALFIERTADRRGPTLWQLPIEDFEVMLELLPSDCKVQLVWINKRRF